PARPVGRGDPLPGPGAAAGDGGRLGDGRALLAGGGAGGGRQEGRGEKGAGEADRHGTVGRVHEEGEREVVEEMRGRCPCRTIDPAGRGSGPPGPAPRRSRPPPTGRPCRRWRRGTNGRWP